MDNLHKVDEWLAALLANLEPAARQRMMRELAQELRRNQQNNIRLQRNPDGSGYEPRKVTARTKKGRIKRQMFAKLRTAKYLKTKPARIQPVCSLRGQCSALRGCIIMVFVIELVVKDRRFVIKSVGY